MIHETFWNGRRVFITGHTGFKGSWLCLWLHSLGAHVTGYALKPPTDPSLFELCQIDRFIQSAMGDVQDGDSLRRAVTAAEPEIVIHMAAQPLVRDSYKIPVETFAINVIGTVNLLEAIRNVKTIRAVLNVTSDKCYENRQGARGYRESDPLGGYDPYSSSKACSELVTAAYRSSYLNPEDYLRHRVGVASARAGNVIGGGDWASDRLVPDSIRAILKGEKVLIRNPQAVRPWQHVLEPLGGYLLLAQRLVEDGPRFSEAWNFGPDDSDSRPVQWLVRTLCERWGHGASYDMDRSSHPHEAQYLKLDCSKAKAKLNWRPRWSLDKALDSIVEWTRAYRDNKQVIDVCLRHIQEYSTAGNA